MRKEFPFRRFRQRRTMLVAAIVLAGPAVLTPRTAFAEGLFDFLFGGIQKLQKAASQGSFFADPSDPNLQGAPSAARVGPAFCVRSCDGKYFPLARGNAAPVQMCQALCPASLTKVFYGSTIDGASSGNGERYADSENAYGFRKALRADCTCNGRNPGGLAPIDLTLDTSLRPGDVIATTDGLVAYSGVKAGASQRAEFVPIASYPGLTAEVRARLGEMKVAPVNAEIATEIPLPEVSRDLALPKAIASPREKRAELN